MSRGKSRAYEKGRIAGPFVPMLIETTNSPAWKAMSAFARVIYHTSLKSRYRPKDYNNGRIYASTRDIAEETGFNQKTAARGLREIEYYGFAIKTSAAFLGVDGKGKAAHWRLTELGYMTEPPTRDFLKWDGIKFYEQKSPAYYKRNVSKKQSPEPSNGSNCTVRRITTEPSNGSPKPQTDPSKGSYDDNSLIRSTVHNLELPSTTHLKPATEAPVAPVGVSEGEPAPAFGTGHDQGPKLDDPFAIPVDLSIPKFMRRYRELALGPLGDSLDDFGACS